MFYSRTPLPTLQRQTLISLVLALRWARAQEHSFLHRFPAVPGSLSLFLGNGDGTFGRPNPPLQIVDVGLTKKVLWPPNRKLVDVTVGYNTTNNCGPATCMLTVVSNEPVNGSGDGTPDWTIIDEHHIRLRAERLGNGSGRIYTVTITCRDSSGDSTSRSVTVAVPKNQRGV